MSVSISFLRPAARDTGAWRLVWARWQAALVARRARRQLAELDDRMLADIGASRSDAVLEASRPIWAASGLDDFRA